MWKDFFYFDRSEKQGVIMLAILICVVILGGEGLSMYKRLQEPARPDHFEEEYTTFIASIKKQDSIKNIARHRRDGHYKSNKKEPYATPSAYIRISKEYGRKDTTRGFTEKHIPLKPDSLKPVKYAPGTVIDLNMADTTELKKIPGIGSAYAKRIVSLRKRLGGFYTIEQLQEINLDTGEFAGWFSIGSAETTRINLNKASIEQLKAHPYFSFYQAKVIIDHRKRKGNLKRLEQLSFYDEFTDKDMERMKHYVCFE